MKKIIFFIITFFVIFSVQTTTIAQAPTPLVSVLLYHNLKTELDKEDDPRIHISITKFDDQLAALKAAGANTITYQEYVDAIEGKATLPPKSVIITFDDGYISNYTEAYPRLKRMGMKGVIFMVTAFAGITNVKIPHFTWEQAAEMQNSGVIDIQSHSDTHANIAELTEEKANLEFRRSKYMIETKLGKKCDVFAFPYGGNTQESRDIAFKAGYKVVRMVGDTWEIEENDEDERNMRCLTVSDEWTGAELLRQMGWTT